MVKIFLCGWILITEFLKVTTNILRTKSTIFVPAPSCTYSDFTIPAGRKQSIVFRAATITISNVIENIFQTIFFPAKPDNLNSHFLLFIFICHPCCLVNRACHTTQSTISQSFHCNIRHSTQSLQDILLFVPGLLSVQDEVSLQLQELVYPLNL